MLLIKKDAILRLFLRPGMDGQMVFPYTIRPSAIPGACISQEAMTMVRLLSFLCLLLLLTGASPAFAEQLNTSCADRPSATQYDEIAEVRHIHDGDTIQLRDGRKVRLIGINTPELARGNEAEEAYASEAKKTLRSLFNNDKSIGLVFGEEKKDHYGRFLAHVFSADKQDAQAALLKQGHAFAITIPPNTQLAACYLALEHEARCRKQGLWQGTTIVAASELNKSHNGFHLIQGKVKSIKTNMKGLWLNMDDKLTVGIRPDNQNLFDIKAMNTLLNQSIIVRGWLNKSDRSTPFYMRVRHPLSIQLAANYSCD